MNLKNTTGQKYTTNEGYEVVVIDYIDKNTVLAKFVDIPDYHIWTNSTNLRNGQIKNPYHKTVFGIGYYGVGNFAARKNTVKTEEYIKWFSMFNRCYNEKVHMQLPQYKGCSVAEEFHSFQNFAEWYRKKIYPSEYKLELDKDLLIDGNKIYSPSACCFLPKEINTTLNTKRKDKDRMRELYLKYRKCVPPYIKEKLLELSM